MNYVLKSFQKICSIPLESDGITRKNKDLIQTGLSIVVVVVIVVVVIVVVVVVVVLNERTNSMTFG